MSSLRTTLPTFRPAPILHRRLPPSRLPATPHTHHRTTNQSTPRHHNLRMPLLRPTLPRHPPMPRLQPILPTNRPRRPLPPLRRTRHPHRPNQPINTPLTSIGASLCTADRAGDACTAPAVAVDRRRSPTSAQQRPHQRQRITGHEADLKATRSPAEEIPHHLAQRLWSRFTPQIDSGL